MDFLQLTMKYEFKTYVKFISGIDSSIIPTVYEELFVLSDYPRKNINKDYVIVFLKLLYAETLKE